ncbi:MAG: hypothetical protein ABJH45_13285 [Paracoccaceae bacterium]
MSLLSRLKTIFVGMQSTGSGPTETKLSIPEVKNPVVQKAQKDQRSIRLAGQTTDIEPGIECDELQGSASQIAALPDDLIVHARLALSNCKKLTDLPESLSVPSVNLSGCTALERLPSKMNVTFLNLSGCPAINTLPEGLRISGGILNLSGCTGLKTLPDNMGEVAGLNLNGCPNIKTLPAGLKVSSWMDITGTGITEIPEAYALVGFRRGNDVVSAEEALAG